MHEWGIAQSIIDKVRDAAGQNKLAAVTKVEINLGSGLGITVGEFLFCLKALTKENALFERCTFVMAEVDAATASIEAIEGDEQGRNNHGDRTI